MDIDIGVENNKMTTKTVLGPARKILGNPVHQDLPDLTPIRHRGPHSSWQMKRPAEYWKARKRHSDLRYKSLVYEHGYESGPGQWKLNNLYIGKKEGWRLQDSKGNDLGALTVAVVSDMTQGDKLKGPKIGPITAFDHLMKEHYVQQNSFLLPHQTLPPSDAREVLQDPNEKSYTHVVAEVADKRYEHGLRGVSFDVVERAKFKDGEHYVKMFYIPTSLETKNEDFSKAVVVKRNGHVEPLDKLIERLSLDHIGGRKALAVYDAPEAELKQLKPKKFRALAPKFDVPEIKARTSRELSTKADEIYVVVRPSERDGRYKFGVELDKAFQLFDGYVRQSYIDEYVSVHGNREFKLKRVESAEPMYFGGINRLVASAVKHNGQLIVPYADVDVSKFKQLTQTELTQLTDKHLDLGKQLFTQYKRISPD